jgi:hypothetical protein
MQRAHDDRHASAAMESMLLSMARRRRRVATGLLVVMGLNTACYVDKPLATTPTAGQNVSLLVSDQGRVSLGPQLGAGVHVVEGRLASVEGDDFLVNVSRVRPLKGPPSNWTGEQVRIRRGDVAVFQERRISKSRSLLVAGIAAGAVVLFATTRSLFGLGEDDEVKPPGDPDPDR